MKKTTYIQFCFLVSFFILFGSCKKDYYSDGGVLDDNVGVFNISTMEYLRQHVERFDTLLILIRLSGLEDAVNRQNTTFMAPQNYSISNYLKMEFARMENPPSDVRKLPDEMIRNIKAILKNYIIPDNKITSADLNPSYAYFKTLDNRTVRFNIIRSDYLGNVNKGAELINFSFNTSSDPDIEKYQSVAVVISDLQTNTGIVHVLDSDTHIFGFN